MLYLESFLHRVELAEVVSRWIVNRPEPEDVQTLKRIVNFNSYVARIWVHQLAKELMGSLHGRAPESFVAKTKGELKDLIVQNPPYTNARIDELFSRYRAFPGDFYRETPFDGRCYFLSGDRGNQRRYVGSTRIKRFRRIAEKGSRRIIDYLYDRIRANADALAEDRARRQGIPKSQLITPEAEQIEEFLQAERRLFKAIHQGSIQTEFPILSIPDVVGIKVVCDGDQHTRLLQTIEQHPRCTLLEEERHSGRYNALNLRVAYTIPRDHLAKNPPSRHQLNVLAYRGFNPDTVCDEYQEFLDTANDHVLLEVIVSNYAELLESEIGRSMHEERVLEQRSHLDYNSHLGTNVFYLMDFILALCLAPNTDPITDVPIKLWMRYTPDTPDRLSRRLFWLPIDASFDDVNSPVVPLNAPRLSAVAAKRPSGAKADVLKGPHTGSQKY